MNARGALLGSVVVAALTGCGAPGTSRISGVPAGAPSQAYGGRAIDWAHPLTRGVASSRANAKAQGRLVFDPIVPAWEVSEKGTDVTDPAVGDPAHAAVAFYYEFPTGSDFPADGRISVMEAPTDQTEADLATMAESNGAEHFHMIVVNDRPALLIEANGIGRVRLIRHGVVIDVTGPAAPPATVVRLASAFG